MVRKSGVSSDEEMGGGNETYFYDNILCCLFVSNY